MSTLRGGDAAIPRGVLGEGDISWCWLALCVAPTQAAPRVCLGENILGGGGGADKVDMVRPTRPSAVTLNCPKSFVQL